MESVNANDGTLTLRVTFDVDSSIDIDQVNTQNKVAQAQPQPPRKLATKRCAKFPRQNRQSCWLMHAK